MPDQEKFAGFRQKLIEDNEEKYGGEIRAKYGDEAVDKSYAKVAGITPQQYAEVERLSQELSDTLQAACAQGYDAAGELARQACELHRSWLSYFWDSYSKEAHLSLAQMYLDDPRFTANYDKIAPGCARFLRDAIENFA